MRVLLPAPPTHVIFDLDGTLLDTEPLYAQATETVLRRYGKQYEPELKRRITGSGPLNGARVVVETLALPLEPEAYLAERDAVLNALLVNVSARPGAVDLIEELWNRDVPLAIATSSRRAVCLLKLAPHAFVKRFRTIVCSDDVGVRNAKPSPDLFLRAAADLGAVPARCLVFEDSRNGVLAAHAAGMQVIAIPEVGAAHEDFREAIAVVASLELITASALGL